MSARAHFVVGVIVACLFLASTVGDANASVIFYQGNNQFTNVNFAGDQNGATITGEIDKTGVTVDFTNALTLAGDPMYLHGQDGVAWVQACVTTPCTTFTSFYTMDVIPEAGYGFSGMDFKLDETNGYPAGWVLLTAWDQFGTLYSAKLPIDPSGQNPYYYMTADNELVTKLTIGFISAGDPQTPLWDLKQVSAEAAPVPTVPEPGSLLLLGSGLFATARYFGNRRH